MNLAFDEVLAACVAGWKLLKENLRTGCISPMDLRAKGSWRPDCLGLKNIASAIAPYPYQRDVYRELRRMERGVVVVEAATASGKTEAAVASFLIQLVEDNWDLAPRLIYTQPTRALTFTTYARFIAYTEGLACYGLPRLTTSYEYGTTFTHKHYLYGGVLTAATLDAVIYGFAAQRVPGGLKNPRLNMPTGLLATSLFILDEVQLYQDEHYYSPVVLRMVLDHIVNSGGLALILTATLPSILREVLVGKAKGLLDWPFKKLPHEYIQAQPVKRRSITLSFQPEKLEDLLRKRDIIKRIEQTLSEGMHVLIVANTVRGAVRVYELIKKAMQHANVILLHGKLTTGDRELREGELFRRKACVIVSTQVVEAGFDLDASLLITELAPLDSLIQRAGRVARSDSMNGEVIIADVENTEPYPQILIDTTRDVLQKNVQLLGQALDSVDVARSLLDQVYTQNVVLQLQGLKTYAAQQRSGKTKKNSSAKQGRGSVNKRQVRELQREAARYLRGLRLLSFPPENDFRLREGFYVTIVSLDKLSELIGEGIKTKGAVLLEKPFEEAEKITSGLEEASMTLGHGEAKKIWRCLEGELHIKRNKDNLQVCVVRRVQKEGDVRPFRVYLLREGHYHSEKGLWQTEQSKDEEAPKRKRQRMRNSRGEDSKVREK